MLRCILVGLFISLISCTSNNKQSGETPQEDTAESVDPGQSTGQEDLGAPDTGTNRPPIQAEYLTNIGDWTMAPGKEITKCVIKRLTNEEEIWVSSIHIKNGKGSHHLIVYKSAETTEKTTPFECDPFIEVVAGDTLPLMISQIGEEELKFPSGVAFKFEPRQMVRIEAHYLNYFSEDITAHADISFKTIAQEDVENEANILFYGSPDFSLPPGKVTKSDLWFLDVWEGSKIFAITGHTHQYGIDVKIFNSDSKSKQGEQIYPPEETPFNWAEAPVTYFDPPLSFDGKQGFHYQCVWENTSNKNVEFGESSSKEMCFFWAYYYPSKGYRLCINPGKYALRAPGLIQPQECCPGSIICDFIKQFLENGLP
jgi:hypothetical protein